MDKLVKLGRKHSPLLQQPFWLLVAFFCLFGASASGAADPKLQVAQEDKIRAAVVVGIVRYTRWDVSQGESLNICLDGDTESFLHLEALQNSRLIQNKTLHVYRIDDSDRVLGSACHVLVMGPESSVDFETIAKGESCLVICDGCAHKKEEAAVILRKEANRIRFDVYLERAKKHKIHFSAAMLELAAHIEGRYE